MRSADTKVQRFRRILLKLSRKINLTKEDLFGMMAICQTDEQINEVLTYILEHLPETDEEKPYLTRERLWKVVIESANRHINKSI